jgi:hypothetical protein
LEEELVASKSDLPPVPPLPRVHGKVGGVRKKRGYGSIGTNFAIGKIYSAWSEENLGFSPPTTQKDRVVVSQERLTRLQELPLEFLRNQKLFFLDLSEILLQRGLDSTPPPDEEIDAWSQIIQVISAEALRECSRDAVFCQVPYWLQKTGRMIAASSANPVKGLQLLLDLRRLHLETMLLQIDVKETDPWPDLSPTDLLLVLSHD